MNREKPSDVFMPRYESIAIALGGEVKRFSPDSPTCRNKFTDRDAMFVFIFGNILGFPTRIICYYINGGYDYHPNLEQRVDNIRNEKTFRKLTSRLKLEWRLE